MKDWTQRVLLSDPCFALVELRTLETCLVEGCLLGEAVAQIIPQNTFIRVPDAPNIDCYRACWCSRNGLIHRCNQLKCVGEEQCIMASGMIQSKTLSHSNLIVGLIVSNPV